MNISRQADPRANQKERTRAAIVEAAMELVRTGVTPTVQTAAEAARVSRATAYRYFPTQDALLNEVLYVTPTTDVVDEALKDLQLDDPEARLLWLLGFFNPIVLEQETQYRAALRISLETWFSSRSGNEREAPAVRAGRRMRWLTQILEPLRQRLPEPEWNRLRYALALTVGMDSVIILKDVCRLEDQDEILEVLSWAARALLRAALQEASQTSA